MQAYRDFFEMPEEEFTKMDSQCRQIVEHSEGYLKGFEDCKRQMTEKIGKALGYLGLFKAELEEIKRIKPE